LFDRIRAKARECAKTAAVERAAEASTADATAILRANVAAVTEMGGDP
jgi:hypothetical protein